MVITARVPRPNRRGVRSIILAGFALVAASGVSFAQSAEEIIKKHCAQEWPNDYSMRAYCEKQQRKAALDLGDIMDSKRHGMPQQEFEKVLSMCWFEWMNDYSMTLYCLKRQIEGYAEVTGGAATSPLNVQPTPDEERTIKRQCQREWPDDFSMRSYCEKKQLEGLTYVMRKPDWVSASMWSRAKSHCRGEWPNDYSMQAYCTKRQIEP